MKCYYHPTVDAVAICKNCGKALCPESAVDMGYGVACKDSCEAEVEAMIKVFQQSKKSFENYSQSYAQISRWMALMGIGLIIAALFLRDIGGFLGFWGALTLVGAVIVNRLGHRYKA